MGLNLGKIAIGAITGFATGGPAGAFVGSVGAAQQEKAANKFKQQQTVYEQQVRERQQKMAEIFQGQNLTRIQPNLAGQNVSSGGFGSQFGTFLTDVGRNIISPFTGLATQLAPFFTRSAQQQPAVTTTGGSGAQESQTSGTQTAFVGGGLPQLVNIGRQFLKSPVGQIGVGTGVGSLLGGMGLGQPAGVRITRKMKSQARMVVNLTGGDLARAAEILEIDQSLLITILLKRFRNDGPVITKAALRKTKTTVRRMKNMCDMYDSLRPAAKRRATPMRRAGTTLISNK